MENNKIKIKRTHKNESKWAKYTNPTKVFKLPEQEKQGLHERNRKKVQKMGVLKAKVQKGKKCSTKEKKKRKK